MIEKPLDFEEELKRIKKTLFQVLGSEYVGFREEAKKDIETFMNLSKDKLERWTKLLSQKQITLDEYEWLVKSQKELLQLNELEKAGVSKINMGHIKNKTISAMLDIGKEFFHRAI